MNSAPFHSFELNKMSLEFHNKPSRPSFSTTISGPPSANTSIPLSSLINTSKKPSFSSNSNVANNNSTTSFHNGNNTSDSESLFGMSLLQAAKISSIPTILNFNESYILYLNLPSIIRITIDFLVNNDCYEKEGIFRVSGSMKRINQLQESFIENPKFNLYQMNNETLNSNDQLTVFDVATLLKRYLNTLPNSIIPQSIFKEIKTEIISKSSYKDLLLFSNNANDISSLNIFDSFTVDKNFDTQSQGLKTQIKEILTFMASVYYTKLDPTNMDVFLFVLKFLSLLSMDGNYQRTKMNSFNLGKIFQLSFFLSNDHQVDLSNKYANLHSSAIINNSLNNTSHNGKVSVASISGPTNVPSESAIVDEDDHDDPEDKKDSSTIKDANLNAVEKTISDNNTNDGCTSDSLTGNEPKVISSNADIVNSSLNNSNLFFNHADFSFESFNSINADYNLNQLLLKILIDNFDGFLTLLFDKYCEKKESESNQPLNKMESENENESTEENANNENDEDVHRILRQVFVEKSWYESKFGPGSLAANFDDSGISKVSEAAPFYSTDIESKFSIKKEKTHRRKSKLNFMSMFNGMADLEREVAFDAKQQQKKQQKANLQKEHHSHHFFDVSGLSEGGHEPTLREASAEEKVDAGSVDNYDTEEIIPLRNSVSTNAPANSNHTKDLQRTQTSPVNGNGDLASLGPGSISLTTTHTNASLTSSQRKKKDYGSYPVDKSSGRISVFNIFTPPPKKVPANQTHHSYDKMFETASSHRRNIDNRSIHSHASSSTHTTATSRTILKPPVKASSNLHGENDPIQSLSRRKSILSPFLGSGASATPTEDNHRVDVESESIKQHNNEIPRKKSHKIGGTFRLANFMISSKSMGHIPTGSSKPGSDRDSNNRNTGALDHQPEMTQVEDGDVTIGDSLVGDNTLNGTEEVDNNYTDNAATTIKLADDPASFKHPDETVHSDKLELKKVKSVASILTPDTTGAVAAKTAKGSFFLRKKAKEGSKNAEKNNAKSQNASSGNSYMKKRFSNWFSPVNQMPKE